MDTRPAVTKSIGNTRAGRRGWQAIAKRFGGQKSRRG